MDPISFDTVWFRAHPDRRYRLRRQTPEEWRSWPVPPRPGIIAWCIVERATGTVTPFGLDEDETWDNDWDEALERLLGDVRVRAA